MVDLREVFDTEHSGLDTFLGLPKCDDLSQLDAAVAIIGAPVATPYPGFGLFSATAPDAIRQAFIYDAPVISHHDFDIGGSILDEEYGKIVDAGDLPTSETDFAHNRALIANAVGQILDAGAKPLVIGGDDSIPIPVFQAFAGRDKYTILQIDAHIDWRDEVRGERFGLSSTMRRASEMEGLEQIIQVGMRSAGSARTAEYHDALAWGAKIITAQQVYRQGVTEVIDFIPADSNVLVTFDCDALDSGIMPAVMSPTPGGLMYWDVVELLQGVAKKANLCGFNLVEFMPDRDTNGTAGLLAARIIFNAAALMAKQHT
ncbi:MAG: arginase family protein [Chloroflexota bacterium]